MRELEAKIRISEKMIREAEVVLETATPHSNREKAARKQLEKHRKLLTKCGKELRRAA